MAVAATQVSAASALAQSSLPEAIVEAPTVSPEQQAEIQRFVDQQAPALTGQDNGQLTRARKTLMRPMDNARASVDFRFKYGDALAPVIEQAIKNKNEQAVVNALILVSNIGTDQSTRPLEESLAARNVAIRYAAVRGLGRTLSIASRGTPALTQDRASAIVILLARVVEEEPTADIADAAMRGLEAGLELATGQMRGVRAIAMRELGRSGAKRMQGMKNITSLQTDVAGLAQAGAAIRQVLTLPGVQPQMRGDAIEAAAAFGDEMLRLVARHVQGEAFKNPNAAPEDLKKERTAAATLVRLGQGVTVLALTLPDPTKEGKDPAAALEKGTQEGDAEAVALIEAFLKR